MKPLLTCLMLSWLTFALQGQSWEIFTAVNLNNYFDVKTCEGHCMKDFTPGKGLTLGVAWTNHIMNNWEICTRVFVEQYNGGVYYSDGGNGGSDVFRLNVKKTTLGLTLTPWVIRLKKVLKLDMGTNFNLLLYDDTVGKNIYYRLGQMTLVEPIPDASSLYLNSITAGVHLKLQYNICIRQDWMICPFYALHFGVSNEFKNLDTSVKSVRNSIGVAVGWER